MTDKLRGAAQQVERKPIEFPTTDDPVAAALFWLNAALRCPGFDWDHDQKECAEGALRAALAQQDAQAVPQEPYCHIYEYDSHFGLHREFYPREWNGLKPNRCIPVYATTTPPEQCVELTVEEIGEAALSAGCDPACDDGALVVRLAHAVIEAYERKNGIK